MVEREMNQTIGNVRDRDNRDQRTDTTRDETYDESALLSCACDIFSRQITQRFPLVEDLYRIDSRTLQDLVDVSISAAPQLFRLVSRTSRQQQRRAA